MPNAGPDASDKQRSLFAQYLNAKNAISQVSEPRPGFFTIRKTNGHVLSVRLVDIYTLSEADVVRIMSEDAGLSAIVTASAWNQYTADAKAFGRSERVGVFGFKEFMSAVHKDGDEFLAYKG